MNKILSLLIISLFISCSQNRYHIDETTNPTDTLCYLKSDMSLLNGVVYNEFGDIGLFKNGKREGLNKIWYDDGQIMSKRKYKNGKWVGLHKVWYENGQLKFEGSFKEGVIDGLRKIWYENGPEI